MLAAGLSAGLCSLVVLTVWGVQPLVSLVSASQLLFKQFVYNWPDAKPLISQSEFAKDLVVLGAAVLNDIHIWYLQHHWRPLTTRSHTALLTATQHY